MTLSEGLGKYKIFSVTHPMPLCDLCLFLIYVDYGIKEFSFANQFSIDIFIYLFLFYFQCGDCWAAWPTICIDPSWYERCLYVAHCRYLCWAEPNQFYYDFHQYMQVSLSFLSMLNLIYISLWLGVVVHIRSNRSVWKWLDLNTSYQIMSSNIYKWIKFNHAITHMIFY